MRRLAFKRCILKLTGESFSDTKTIERIAAEIKQVYNKKIDMAIVLGGGNFFRGRDAKTQDKLITDRAGMLGTVINGILLEHLLKPNAVHLSALGIKGFVKSYSVERSIKYFKEKKILVFSGGTGLPYFSTDTATALRACELGADLILKATNVPGVYDRDPKKDRQAKLIKKLSYNQVINKDLQIMDRQAFALLQDKRIPIVVFDVFKRGNLAKVLTGQEIGSIIC